jgi:DNA-binding transcriptional regulator YdaS (Cro superfamily)
MGGFKWDKTMTLEWIRIEATRQALLYSNGNKSKAARLLGVSVHVVNKMIEREAALAAFRSPTMAERYPDDE